jgi:diaminopimelate epimerase
VLVLLPPEDPAHHARLRILNGDGSEAEMCGNGIRCVAKYLFDHDPSLALPVLNIETGAGVLACAIETAGTNRAQQVAVDMGRPRLRRSELPMKPRDGTSTDERCIAEPIDLNGERFAVTAVSMGNPHGVIFVDGSTPLTEVARRVGPHLEHHDWFPKRTNAEFARIHSPTEIELVVYERGCGITMACGTGACATVVAAIVTGRAQTETDVTVLLPGGPLSIRVAADLMGVRMRGPATEVFRGEVQLMLPS